MCVSRVCSPPIGCIHSGEKNVKSLVGCLLGILIALPSFAAEESSSGVFMLRAASFEDNGKLALKNAGDDKSNPNCVGQNVSPALKWSNPPPGTRSYALIMYDPEGRGGLGVVH